MPSPCRCKATKATKAGIFSGMAMTLRLPAPINDKLREAARQDHESMQVIAAKAISDYLQRRELTYIRHVAREVAHRDAEILAELSRS